MKKIHKLSSWFRSAAVGVAFLFATPWAHAQVEHFRTPSLPGSFNGATFSWDDTNWRTSGSGPYSYYVPGSFPEFAATGNYTVTCGNVESLAGLYQMATGTLTITNLGSGGFSLPAAPAAATQNGFSWLVQNFFAPTGTINLYVPISGSGGVEPGGGTLALYGSNSFTGGTLFSASNPINFNNNNSFGAASSQIGVDATTAFLINNGPVTVNIPNPVQTIGNSSVVFTGNSCTYSGDWYLGGGTNAISLRNNTSGTTVTLAGVLSATTGTVTYSAATGGTILLTRNNTYIGLTSVGTSGSTNFTLEIAATGSLAGNVTNFGGTLKLDAPTNLKTNASLFLLASAPAGSINLNYTGTQTIAALYIGGVAQTGSTWGAPGSGAANTSPIFGGTGLLSLPAAPAIVSQPQPAGRLAGGTATFSVAASGTPPLSYQWESNGIAIPGATLASYSFSPVASNSVGSFSCLVSNAVGTATSAGATLTVSATNYYTTTIVGDQPMAYWRLDETNGTVALDYISTNDGTYVNVTLNQPGFSVMDTDGCIGLPATTNSRGYVVVSNSAATFNFTSSNTPFTLEARAYFTNLSGVQSLFSTLGIGNGIGNGYAFGIVNNNVLRFTQGGVQDADLTLGSSNALITNEWYYFAVACDETNYYYYLNGTPVGTATVGGETSGNNGIGYPAVSPLTLGANLPGYPYSEQFYGKLAGMAIYNKALSPAQIVAHSSPPLYPP